LKLRGEVSAMPAFGALFRLPALWFFQAPRLLQPQKAPFSGTEKASFFLARPLRRCPRRSPGRPFGGGGQFEEPDRRATSLVKVPARAAFAAPALTLRRDRGSIGDKNRQKYFWLGLPHRPPQSRAAD